MDRKSCKLCGEWDKHENSGMIPFSGTFELIYERWDSLPSLWQTDLIWVLQESSSSPKISTINPTSPKGPCKLATSYVNK